jgi:lytic cellulose monooxygenase (C1-hydroxylating)
MLANCEGPCQSVDKAKLKWNPLEKVGLIDSKIRDYPGEEFSTGFWAADKLIDDGYK